MHTCTWFFFFFLSLFFLLFRAAPTGYGGSQARGQIGATATAQATATVTPDLSLVCNLYCSSWQRWILNPLSEARHRTHNLMVASRICFCCTTTGTLSLFLFKHFCAWFVLKLLQSICESHCPLVLAIVIFCVKKNQKTGPLPQTMCISNYRHPTKYIKPTTSWFLVGFVTAVPQWELRDGF